MDEELEEATIYQINRWDCPACGNVHESDGEFENIEWCDDCREKVRLR